VVRGPVTRVGRAGDNDVVVDDSPLVSGRHLEIRLEGGFYRVCDLNSTNGTYLQGEKVEEAVLQSPCTLRLGPNGPELGFELSQLQAAGADQTLVAGPGITPARPSEKLATHEQLLSHAVTRARAARHLGTGNQTITIMREVLDAALHRSARRFQAVIVALVFALTAVTSYGFWRIQGLKQEKGSIDAQIQRIESLLEKGPDSASANELLARLNQYQNQAREVEDSLFYRVGVWEREDFLEREIRALLEEFGAETYSLPPEFREQVRRFIDRYQGSDRPHMVRALGQSRSQMEAMRRIFQQDKLPPDLAYMVLVESALSKDDTSPAGAAGLWQFTPATARAYGLKVSPQLDERLDTRKSTQAACRYMRELILDFGSGSSVMLALAAYNLGPTRVKQEIRKISDPIQQRNFWYLYRVRALPVETREYVPKVIAAMIVGRNPSRFGF
jgi:soluble lytic murein transglycosylase-like protein